jgi:hypothetical protein
MEICEWLGMVYRHTNIFENEKMVDLVLITLVNSICLLFGLASTNALTRYTNNKHHCNRLE